MEVRACMRYLVKNPGPSYLRLGKAGEPSFHLSVPDVQPGKWLRVAPPRGGSGRVLLTTGATLAMAMDWRETGVFAHSSVASMPLWGMAQKKLQIPQFEGVEELVTVEDHLLDGGFGSWMEESVRSHPLLRARVKPVGLSDIVCGSVGTQSTLNALGGLTPA